MRRPCSLTLVLALNLGLALACAKPTSERPASSGALDDPLDQADQAYEGEAPTSCPASSPRQVRYASTFPRSRHEQLRPELAGTMCIAEGRDALANEIACAQAYNRANWEQALAARGLSPVELEVVDLWLNEALTPGSVHPHPDDREHRLVYLAQEVYGHCSGTTVHTTLHPGVSLARNAEGALVVVRPKPTIEARDYPLCACFPGCGVAPAPGPQRFALIDAKQELAEPVELGYAAISISTHAVDIETCCCAP